MSFDIQVPQWATVLTDQFLLSNVSATAFSNTILGGGIQGSYFTVSGNDLQLAARTFNTNASTAASSPYVIRDQSSNAYTVFFNVYPSPMAVSPGTTNVLYQQRTAGLPITLQPQTDASGYINTTRFPTTLSGTFTSNAQFSPVLPPGLTSNLVGQVMTIAGTPTTTRVNAGTYTQQVKGSLGRLMSQAITISVQNPQVEYTNISGFSTLNNQLGVTVNQGVSNEFQVSIDPVPIPPVVVGSLPTGLTASLSGTNVLVVSGTATSYPDNGIATAAVQVRTALYNSNTLLTLAQSPTVTLNTPLSIEQYSNVPLSFSVGAEPRGTGTVTVAWSLNPSAGLTISPTGLTATISGAISANTSVGVKATISGTDISSSTTIPLFALTDSVTFSNGNSDYSEIVQLEQAQDSSGEFLAQAASQQPITQTVSDPVGLNNQQLTLSGGVITGQPLTAGQLSLSLFATTPQGVSNVRNLSQTFLSNTITFDPSQNFLVRAPVFIEGRPIEIDQTDEERRYRATTSQGTLVQLQQTNDLNNTGLTITNAILGGTPVVSLSADVVIQATRGNTSNTLSLGQIIQPDQLFLAQPTQSDFVVSTGETLSQALQGQTQSESSISAQSLSGSVTGVSVSTDGVLTMTGVSAGGPTEFIVNAQTQAGYNLSKTFTLTVNSGTFTSPTATSALMPIGSSLAVETNPLTPLTLSSAVTGFTFTDVANQYTFSNQSGNVQPPQLVVFESSPSLKFPLRVATDTLTLTCSVQSANWIQQIPIDTITVSGTSPSGGPVQFACPNPPPGLTWNPLLRTLTGAPRQLTLLDRVTFQATDGLTSGAITVSYRVRVPQQLRGFTSPSGFTQQVRQRAIVNGAVHAINRTAQLPDPLIATQGGSYPPDVAKPDQACIDGIVYQF